MKFAQFQSTYKGLPLEVFEKTGQVLEEKYYKNREESSQLRQYLSTMNVEDRNMGHLAKATSDVESMLEEVNGKWHYANNILYNAKERIGGDKLLKASMEDYQKSETYRAEQQKRFEEGKIGEDAYEAYLINNKRFNDKPIEQDEFGQVKNRWYTPPPPSKIDIDKKVLDIVTLLSQHKDSLPAGKNNTGSPVYELYKANPTLEGFVDKYTASGVSPEKIANAVSAWINTTPEVKNYYNYINDAKLFNELTLRDDEGQYLKDEAGNYLQRDLTAKDFRDLGIKVTDDWKTLSNVVELPGVNGLATMASIRGMTPNFKETHIFQELLAQGATEKEALQHLYKNALTSNQLQNVVDFGSSFAFSEFDSDTIKNEGYWFNKNLAQKRKEEANLFEAWSTKAPMIKNTNFSLAGMNKQKEDLVTARDAYKPGTPEWNTYNAEIRNLDNIQKGLRNTYFDNTPEGATVLQNTYAKLLKQLPNKDRELFKQHEEEVKKYLSGKSTTLGFEYNGNARGYLPFALRPQATNPIIFGPNRIGDALADAKINVGKAFEKSIADGNVNYDITTLDFVDDNNELHPISTELGNLILDRGNSFVNLGALNKQGEKMTLDDYYAENNIDRSNYDPIAQFSDNYGTFVIKFVPNKADVKPLDNDARIVIQPNPANEDAIMSSVLNLVRNKNVGVSSTVNSWLNQQTSNLIFNNTFEPIRDKLASVYANTGSANFNETIKEFDITDVPISKTDSNKLGMFKLVFTSNNTIDIYQIDPKTNAVTMLATKPDIDKVQDYFFNQYINK